MDWDDNSYGDNRRNDEEDDFDVNYLRIRQPRRGGILSATAVISLAVGSLAFLFATCTGVFAGNNGVRFGFGGGTRDVEKVITFEILFFLGWGVLSIAAGVGLLLRQQWARIVALVLAGVASLAGLGEIVFSVIVLSAGSRVPQVIPMLLLIFLVKMVMGLILVFYCIWTYVVLLNSRNASEFS
jgi:hypothetical protein